MILSKEDHAAAPTLHTQPALFAIEYASPRVWAMLGVEPQVVLGHSVGEIVASVLAGVLSLGTAASSSWRAPRPCTPCPRAVGA